MTAGPGPAGPSFGSAIRTHRARSWFNGGDGAATARPAGPPCQWPARQPSSPWQCSHDCDSDDPASLRPHCSGRPPRPHWPEALSPGGASEPARFRVRAARGRQTRKGTVTVARRHGDCASGIFIWNLGSSYITPPGCYHVVSHLGYITPSNCYIAVLCKMFDLKQTSRYYIAAI